MFLRQHIQNLIQQKRETSILALDLASNCGWAHTDGTYGVWQFKVERDESRDIRLIRLANNIRTVYNTKGFGLLAFERATVRSRGAEVLHAEFQSVVKLLSDELGYSYKGYSPKSIKKQAGGGSLSKEQMIIKAKKKFGIVENLTHDEADALWLLNLAKLDFSEKGTRLPNVKVL